MQNKMNDLKKRIKEKIPDLTESQKIIANYIVENPRKFALSSVRQLEKELNTSKSTIVRLAKVLGYHGFHELKSLFLDTIRHELEPINRYKTLLYDRNDQSNYLDLIAAETIRNIHDTLSVLDREQYQRTIELVEHADQVYTLGLGISTYLAEVVSYLFNRISIRTNYMTSCAISFLEQIINLSKNDLIIAFSFPPYSPETVEAAKFAQKNGIKVVSVTDKATSKIIQYSDVVLQVAVESMTFSNSIMPVLMIFYAMTTQIGKKFRKKTLQKIKAIEEVRKKND